MELSTSLTVVVSVVGGLTAIALTWRKSKTDEYEKILARYEERIKTLEAKVDDLHDDHSKCLQAQTTLQAQVTRLQRRIGKSQWPTKERSMATVTSVTQEEGYVLVALDNGQSDVRLSLSDQIGFRETDRSPIQQLPAEQLVTIWSELGARKLYMTGRRIFVMS